MKLAEESYFTVIHFGFLLSIVILCIISIYIPVQKGQRNFQII